MTHTIKIEVVYATREKQELLAVTVPEGMTMIEAVRASRIETLFDELKVDESIALGVFGKKRIASDIVREGDRIEIYRPLLADPKEVRRLKAEAKKKAELKAKNNSN